MADTVQTAPTVVRCPGCARRIEVSAEPTGDTWLDLDQWCDQCGGGNDTWRLQRVRVPRS